MGFINPVYQGFMNCIQTERCFITILWPVSIAYFLGTLQYQRFPPLIHFSMMHTRLSDI